MPIQENLPSRRPQAEAPALAAGLGVPPLAPIFHSFTFFEFFEKLVVHRPSRVPRKILLKALEGVLGQQACMSTEGRYPLRQNARQCVIEEANQPIRWLVAEPYIRKAESILVLHFGQPLRKFKGKELSVHWKSKRTDPLEKEEHIVSHFTAYQYRKAIYVQRLPDQCPYLPPRWPQPLPQILLLNRNGRPIPANQDQIQGFLQSDAIEHQCLVGWTIWRANNGRILSLSASLEGCGEYRTLQCFSLVLYACPKKSHIKSEHFISPRSIRRVCQREFRKSKKHG